MTNSRTKKKRILNAAQIKVIFERFAREMAKQYGSLDQVVFIGVRTLTMPTTSRSFEKFVARSCELKL